jgi:hypothetical protein
VITLPRLASPLARRRNRERLPQLLSRVDVVGREESTHTTLATRRTDEHLAVGDERCERHVVAESILFDRRRPDFLTGARIERHQYGLACREEDLVAVQRYATAGRMAQDDALRQTSPVSPQLRARHGIDRDDLIARRRHEHHTVVDNRRRLMAVGRVGREDPHRLQPCHVGRGDVGERTIAPPIVGAPHHQPVAVLRFLEPRGRDGLVVR